MPKVLEPKSVLGTNVREAREVIGMTQLALAHAIGYTGDHAGSYVSRVEAGLMTPRLETLGRMATALGVTIDSLMKKGRK